MGRKVSWKLTLTVEIEYLYAWARSAWRSTYVSIIPGFQAMDGGVFHIKCSL